MPPIVVIDVAAHKATCRRCNQTRLCAEGVRLAELQTTAWLEAQVQWRIGPGRW